jgi:uncharacterized protein YkwD
MWELVNEDRLANWREMNGHTNPLRWDEKLAQIARAHSEDMVQRNFFSHVNPDGQSPVERLQDAGVLSSSVGENISKNHFGVADTEAAFMRNVHRHNILNPQFSHVGIGIVRLPNGSLYVTQVFAEER